MRTMLPLMTGGRLPVVLQTEATECGLACLAMVAAYHGHKIDLNTLRRRFPISLKGVTLKSLVQIAAQMELACRPLRFEMQNLAQLRCPTILHWDFEHFVVLKRATANSIVVHDPAFGERTYTIEEASKHVTGVGLELAPTERFQPVDEAVRLPLSAFWNHARGMGPALLQIFMLSIALQAIALASPYYLQLSIDDVIAKGDVDFMLVLALGFGMLTVISVASTALRSFILLTVQNTMILQMVTGLFRHLVRLPLSYFEKRHVGDILSRFGSTKPIRDLLAEGLIAALIDGIMAVATLVMIYVYSAKLATVVLIALCLYALLRLSLYQMFRRRSEMLIQAEAKEQSKLIETVRAIQSLKLFNRESETEGQWLNRYADVVNANIRLGHVTIAFKTINDAIFGIENLVVVYLAATLALDGGLTVGMIFAFMSYKRSFIEKSVQLIETALDFRILELHLERIADIALNPVERGHDQPLAYARPVAGRIEVRNVCFRYADTEPLVLENVNMTVEPGQFVAIAGMSGGGKTTLLKIMLGLLEPTSGEVLVDGLPLWTIAPQAYRADVAAVMQDDQLLSGSIADNISLFDSDFDMEWMVQCAKVACIHDDIMAMPMTYNSLIGDMGSSLSGGQKQRLLLARALYKRPKILFLDEGTAHLDLETEHKINQALKHLDITRISVAHRPDTLRAAETIFRMGPGSDAAQITNGAGPVPEAAE